MTINVSNKRVMLIFVVAEIRDFFVNNELTFLPYPELKKLVKIGLVKRACEFSLPS